MKTVYIYPKNDYHKLASPNPYIQNLENSLKDTYEIVNKKPNNRGVFDFFPFLFKVDFYLLNWIEDVANRRFGKIQVIAFIFFVICARILNRKIVWVLHNIVSHDSNNKKWTKLLFGLMFHTSDLILTHSLAGVRYVEANYEQHSNKVKYLMHPIEPNLILPFHEKEFDILIWGTIYPYKGIVEFLEYAINSNALKNLRILISGICLDSALDSQINQMLGDNVLRINEFQSIEQISYLASRSRFVLFTYNSDSVLSSGSLMDSIRMGTIIIGPNKGSFRDLAKYCFIKTYEDFSEISEIIRNDISSNKIVHEEVEKFCQTYSWENFKNELSLVLI